MSDITCPICGTAVKYHSRYKKYLYKPNCIIIIRVMCTNKDCRHTHAIIPGFSVPGCSIGMRELNQFITSRAQGETVDESGQCFVDAGMSPDYPEEMHKRLKKFLNNILLAFRSEEELIKKLTGNYAEMIIELTRHFEDNEANPAATLNANCREYKCNPVLFSRRNILLFSENNPKTKISRNPPCLPPP